MKLLLTVCLMAGTQLAFSQILDVKEAAKRKTENRVNNKTDEGIDKGLNKVEEGIGNLFKKKKKKEDTGKQENTNGGSSDKSSEEANTTAAASLKSYSKFDFVPGEKIIYYDDFSHVNVGDFPANYNTNASGEIVTVDGKQGKWLNLTKNGAFVAEGMGSTLPENFTLEMNVGILEDPSNNKAGFGLNFNTDKDKLLNYMFSHGSSVTLHPGGSYASFSISPKDGSTVIENEFQMPQWNVNDKKFARISIWRQKTRLRIYVDETKLMDIPRFFVEKDPYMLGLYRDFFYDCNLLISDIKFAVGAPDTRSKLISEGRFSTTGILFDVNSDQIKASSFGALKEIAAVLKENSSVNVKIIGHTDSDGDDKANLSLSQKRAVAVKNALAAEFGIDASRMQTDGKGESEPAESNSTAQGKANNRRVEFIKL